MADNGHLVVSHSDHRQEVEEHRSHDREHPAQVDIYLSNRKEGICPCQ